MSWRLRHQPGVNGVGLWILESDRQCLATGYTLRQLVASAWANICFRLGLITVHRYPSVCHRRAWFWMAVRGNSNIAGGETLREILASLWQNRRYIVRPTAPFPAPTVEGHQVKRATAAVTRFIGWLFTVVGVVFLWVACEIEEHK